MKQEQTSNRIVSLDVTRGLIMILLAAEACRVYMSLRKLFPDGFIGSIVSQFFHHPWHGLTFWDLVQPSFMLIAGSSLYISWSRRRDKGVTYADNFKHVAWRSLKLFLFGVGLHCIYSGRLVWELWNVLTQLALTTLIAYTIIRWSYLKQFIFSLLLLVLTEILYRAVLIPGYDQPFVKGENFGAYFDVLIMGKHNSGGWAAINFIPTAAHTIWGVLVGKFLISNSQLKTKLLYLVYAGLIGLFIGYGLDWASITPIIKRISTSSFVLVSGGYVLLIIAFISWAVDLKAWNKYAWIIIVVGMNPIFIYLFFETVGKQWFNGVVEIFVGGTFDLMGLPGTIVAAIVALSALIGEWCLCYWLYKRKIFFKL